MAKKYLDDTGMSYFWGKLKDYFQAKLVSGTNIKTINNESVLGSGDISLIDVFYPVGSYYETSDTSFNPNTAWGGTWSLEAEGMVHIGAGSNYTAGDTGGEATHKLTVDEMPSHNHDLPRVMGFVYSTAGGNGTYGSVSTWTTVGNRGGDGAHNNMQPYVVVNRWHRTA